MKQSHIDHTCFLANNNELFSCSSNNISNEAYIYIGTAIRKEKSVDPIKKKGKKTTCIREKKLTEQESCSKAQQS